MICKYLSHSFQRVPILFLSSVPRYQAEYFIFRKWPITAMHNANRSLPKNRRALGTRMNRLLLTCRASDARHKIE